MIAFIILFLLSAPSKAATFENRLLPFSSDGCSRFPDGMRGANWQHCCVEHDLAYWMGGSAEAKASADEALKECVGAESVSILGALMESGVWGGGSAYLPTTWRWGYGWVLNRGYEPLGVNELLQVQSLYPHKSDIIPSYAPTLAQRQSISGDYCLDLALAEIAKRTQLQSFDYEVLTSEIQEVADGQRHHFLIQSDRCYEAQVLTLKCGSCHTPMSELLARGRIRLLGVSEGCEERETAID